MRVFRFGVFEVDAATGELRKQGLRIRLQEQPAQILLMLLDRAGEVVERDEICRRLWPPDTFVDFDQSLGTAMRKLRQALNDDAETPHYIETVPKHGFRFVAPVEKIPAVTPPAPSLHSTDSKEPSAEPARERRGQAILPWTGFALACLLSLVLGWMAQRTIGTRGGAEGQNSASTVRASILPPQNWTFEHSSFAVSPDGARLAFVAFGPDGKDRLWVRALSSPEAQPVNGTDGALLPFWAPDSHRIGFFAAGKLVAVDLNSGAPRVLCDAPFGRGGGAWGPDGTILFSPSVAGPLDRVSDSGGTPVPATRVSQPGQGQRDMWPSFLPDGRHFLYAESGGPADPKGESIFVGSLDGSAPRSIASKTTGNAVYASGYLVYGHDHILWAQRFDLKKLDFSGPPVSVTSQELDQERSFSHAEFSISQNGTLVFHSLSDSRAKLAWFDASGKQLGQIDGTGYLDPRLSPDGRFVAVASDTEGNGKLTISVLDLARGVSTRLTEGGHEESPAWSPDGKKVLFRTLDALKEIPADGSGAPRTLLAGGAYLGHMDWSPTSHLVFTDLSGGAPALKIYSASDGKLSPFAEGAEARFSPDGKWIAYVGPLSAPDSDAVFVAPFPGAAGRIRISTGSGAQPTWSHDGKHVYYVTPDRKLMAVDFDAKTKSVGAPRLLFQTRIIAPNFADTQYAVSRDGRFLVNSFLPNASSPLTLMTGWTASNNHGK